MMTVTARCLLLLAGALPGTTALRAQVAPAGERVRVTTVADGARSAVVIGRVVAATSDSLTVQPDHGAAAQAIPVARITRLEMSGVPYQYGLVGAGAGAGVGSFVGGIIGLAHTPERECPELFFCSLEWSDFRPTVVGMVSGALIGAAIGGIVGHAIGTDHWTDRPLGRAVGVSTTSRGSGLRVSLRF